jgi:hypothetical protein
VVHAFAEAGSWQRAHLGDHHISELTDLGLT